MIVFCRPGRKWSGYCENVSFKRPGMKNQWYVPADGRLCNGYLWDDVVYICISAVLSDLSRKLNTIEGSLFSFLFDL